MSRTCSRLNPDSIEPRCSYLNFRYRACFEKGVPWYSGIYRVWIHSETCTWHNNNIQSIWNQLKSILSNNLSNQSTSQSAIFGFRDLDKNEYLILKHLLLLFKMYIYNARTTGYLNISHQLIYVKGIKDTEKKVCENDAKRRKQIQ